ncbi:MAG: hypothetical protein WC304_03815 [Candidatus Gracilibacteria bacterium]|jgi:hypothetical protein
MNIEANSTKPQEENFLSQFSAEQQEYLQQAGVDSKDVFDVVMLDASFKSKFDTLKKIDKENPKQAEIAEKKTETANKKETQAETLTQLADVRDKFDSNLETGSPITDKDAAELMRLAKKAGKKVTDVAKLVEKKPDGQIVYPTLAIQNREFLPSKSPLVTDAAQKDFKKVELWDKTFIRGELIQRVLPPRELIRFAEIVETFYPDKLENAIQQIYRADETSVFAALHESGLLADSGSEFVSDKRITQWVISNEAAIETGEAQPHQAGIERSNTLSSLEA